MNIKKGGGIKVVYLETQNHANSLYMHVNLRKENTQNRFSELGRVEK